MLMSKLVGIRTKENPSDAIIKSHSLLMRAGFIKMVGTGIWTLAMPAKRIATKIEKVIREEMDKLEGQECSFPVVMPKELWEESGRYSSVGEEMVRLRDRNDRGLVLGMTHEEAAVHLAKGWINSYQQLPSMIYQIQTKFRDEARARGGLIRVREFTMKDAYSFHMSQEDLEAYYEKVFEAYNTIFRRIGLRNFVAIESDSGMMGGSISHEYMLLTEVGEDTVVICPKCDYKANMEVGVGVLEGNRDEVSGEKKEVFTGDAKEIAEICKLLDITPDKTIKAVAYNIKGESGIVLCFIRGDLEVNEAKLKKATKKDIAPASMEGYAELTAGNIGPIGLKLSDAIIVYDESLKNTNNMVIGANKAEYHIVGIDAERDLNIPVYHDIAKVKEGMPCNICGSPLTIQNGIEIGNIFQLGTKYTKSMNMTVLNKEGKAVHPIMGCYGIGVGRAIASIAEEYADDKGLIWPMQVAPWQVYLCPLRLDNELVYNKTMELYNGLKDNGVEVLLDDRDVSPGFKFSDCDLMGIPIRVVISPRSLNKGEVEIQVREIDGTIKEDILFTTSISRIKEIIKVKGE